MTTVKYYKKYNAKNILITATFAKLLETILNIINVSQYCFKIKNNLIFQEMLKKVTDKFNIGVFNTIFGT
jgi:hypothetical protein